MPTELNNDKSTLVQVMAWRRQEAITWTDVYLFLCCQMMSVGHNEVKWCIGILQILGIVLREWDIFILQCQYHGCWCPGDARRQSFFSNHRIDIFLPGLYSLSGRTSYCKISRSLEAARFWLRLFQSLCNLTGTSAAVLPRCLSNFRAIRSS